MKKMTFAAGAIGLFLLRAFAQYNIQSPTISSVTAISTGNGFSLTGNIGQPVVGKATTGSFSVQSGSIGILAVVPIPGGPRLTLSVTTTNTVLLRWPYPSAGFQLDQASAITAGQWTTVTETPAQMGSEWQVILSAPAGNRFYRLKAQ